MNSISPSGKIGIFDSGYGGLTVLSHIQKRLPQYDYIYLGDNARSPYGTRSFEVVYEYTLQSVKKLFDLGCNLVILACNTASAKALRNIQQKDLPNIDPNKRVLGVIRPSVETVGGITKNGHIGILGTLGTIQSQSYSIEISKLFPDYVVTGEACPMWVPLVENGEADSDGADFFIKKNIANLLSNDPIIDTLILGCTHYPLLLNKIKKHTPSSIKIVAQGEIVAISLADYLVRHSEMEKSLSQHGKTQFLTTESPEKFKYSAGIFLQSSIEAEHIKLD